MADLHITVDGNTAGIYIDGTPVGSGIGVSGVPLSIDAGGFIVGQDQDYVVGGGFDANQSWAGEVDNLRIYDRVLKADEISALVAEKRGW